jgi:hypothetical protein
MYGAQGTVIDNGLFITDIQPLWNGNPLVGPPNLTIHGRTTGAGSASVVLNNVASMSMEGSGAITGVNTINGSPYVPGGGGSYPPDITVSTITFNPTNGNISSLNAINNGLFFTETGNKMTFAPVLGSNVGQIEGISTLNVGLSLSPNGDNITFAKDINLSTIGSIDGLSTINGQAWVNGGGGSYPTVASFSTITMNTVNGIINAFAIINPNTNANDFNLSQENATGGIYMNVRPSAGAIAGEIRINGAGNIGFNKLAVDKGIQINPDGNEIEFLQTALAVNQGQIVGLSTINGSSYPPSGTSAFVDAFQIYVAPNGNNTTGTGSQQNPFLTIAQAIIFRATLSTTTEVSIVLSSGTYTESPTLVRNTYLVGITTGESRQPCNVVGTITMNDTTGSMGISGLEVVGNVSMTGAGGVYTVFGCNISSSGNAVNASTGTVFMTECRVSNSSGTAVSGASTLIIRDCVITTSGTGSCINVGASTTIRQTVIQSTSASTGVQPLVTFANVNPATMFLGFNRYEYTSAVVDVTGNKCCIKFSGAGVATANIYQSLLICEGAITGSPQIQCIQDTGAGAVNLSYGGLISGATANHISPAITKTAFPTVA